MQGSGDGSSLVSPRHRGETSIFDPEPVCVRLGRDENWKADGSQDAENFTDHDK